MLASYSKTKVFTGLFLVSIVMTTASCAATGGRDKPKGPPREAIQACADHSRGDACHFKGRRDDQVRGTCIVLSDKDRELVCAPKGGPRREGKPPK
ncbi:MAG: hypothetical protein RBR45_08665 [Pseudomonas sp.]|nr:hypothetical protein [Pseudomonas sp.]